MNATLGMYVCLLITVPGGPPQNLTAELLALDTVNISWSPPPSEVHFGIITQYQIDYFEIPETIPVEPVYTSGDYAYGDNTYGDYLEINAIAVVTVFTADLNIALTRLSSNTTYHIAVAAMNGAGLSPFAIAIRSIPPRKLFCIYVCVCMYCCHSVCNVFKVCAHTCVYYTSACGYVMPADYMVSSHCSSN